MGRFVLTDPEQTRSGAIDQDVLHFLPPYIHVPLKQVLQCGGQPWIV